MAVRSHLCRQPQVMSILDELVQHIRSHAGVWFATHEQIARYVKEHA